MLEGRGVDLFMVETFYDLDELVRRDRGRARGLEPADRRAADLRRGRGDARRRDGARRRRSGSPRSASRRSARTTAPGPRRRWTALEEMGGDGPPLAALPNIGLASLSGGRVDLPARDAGVLRRVRGARARPRRAADRRLLRHDADRDRRDPRRDRRGAGAARAARRRRARARRRARRDEHETRLAARPARGPLRRLGPARPAARRHYAGLLEVAAAIHDAGLGALRRHQRQRDRAARDERADGGGRDRACGRDRDDPAPDAARHDDHGARVDAARRARRGRPQHPRRHRRPARGRRLPGLARRLRGRLDRAHAPDLAPEPRRELQRARRSTRRPRSSSASPSTRPPTTSTSRSTASGGRSTPARASR